MYTENNKTLLRETKEAKIVAGCKKIIKDLAADSSKQDMVNELRAILALRRKKKEENPPPGGATESKQGGDEPAKPQPLLVQEKVLN